MKQAAVFNTITADDWRRAIQRGRAEGNAVLDQIREKLSMSTAATSDIAEAQVVSFLAERSREIGQQFGGGYGMVRLEAFSHASGTIEIEWWIGADKLQRNYKGTTLAEAVVKAGQESPAHIASEMRQQAAKLLAEADALCPQETMPGLEDQL